MNIRDTNPQQMPAGFMPEQYNNLNTNNLKKDMPYTFEYTTPYI